MLNKTQHRADSDGEVPAPESQLETSSQSAVQRPNAGTPSNEATNAQPLLNYVDTKWSDGASLADTDSSMTLAHIANPAPPKAKPSIYRDNYNVDLESTRSRQRVNHAMDSVNSMLIPKPGSPILYDRQAQVVHGFDGGQRGSSTSVEDLVGHISRQQPYHFQNAAGQRRYNPTQFSKNASRSEPWGNPLEDMQVATGQAMQLIRAGQQRIKALEAELAERSAQMDAFQARYIAQKTQNDERNHG